MVSPVIDRNGFDSNLKKLKSTEFLDPAMNSTYKFGWKPEDPKPYRYSGIWSREKTSGPERLVIAPASGQIALIKDLTALMAEPFGILYVLTVPRTEAGAGRYQCPEPITRRDAEVFLNRFEQFFENDGRHHVWFSSVSTSDLFVYDNHNVIYAYGQLGAFEDVLRHHGLKLADIVRFPDPHIHNYNPLFDNDEEALLRYWDWKYLPLQETDD